MIPIDRPLTMVIDARRRDLARVFLAAFVALSLIFSAAGAAGPVNVVMAAEASGGEANPEDAAAGGDAGAPGEGAGESDEAANGGEPEAGSGEGEEPGHDDEDSPEPGAGEGEAITEDGIADLPAVQLMGGPGGGGHGGGNGTVVIHKFGKGAAGNEFPLNGARFKVEREEEVCTIIILPPFFLCWHDWKSYKTVTDNGQDDHDKDAPGVIELRLPAGKYRITEDRAPNGYDRDTKTKVELTVKAGNSYGPFKFVNQLKITKPAIVIKKYADENNNGKIDKHDTLLGGVTFLVEHLVRSGKKWVVNESFHVTDNGPDDDDPTPGVILLNKVSLNSGSNQYRVTEIPPEGWVALTPPITKEITKEKSSSQVVFEFLNQRVPEPDPEPDLSVVKTLIDPESGVATKGDLVVFKITVENTGEVALGDIQVTDTFEAAYLQFVGIDEIDDEQQDGSKIRWAIPSLDVGDSVTYTARFIAKAATTEEGTINQVKVKAGDLVRRAEDEVVIVEPEPEPEPEPDLRVLKTLTDPESGIATVGDPVLFQITVENTGEVALEDIQVTDAFDADYLEFVGIDEVNDEQVNGNEISWQIESLAVEESVTYTVRFIAKAATGAEGTINHVQVQIGDLVRQADDEVVIVDEPTGDLVIYKYDGEDRDRLLGGAVFLVTGDGLELEVADNEDGKDADSSGGVIRIKGLRPGWYEVKEIQAPAGYRLNPEPEPVEIACPEPVGPTLTVYEAEDSPCGEAVVVFFNEREEDDAPRTPGRVPRTPRVDLAVSKVVDDPTPQEGQQVTFTITVTNGGPDDAEGVVYSDLIPAGLMYVSHSASQGNYDPVSGEWEVGDLADGASATLMVTVIVDAGTAGQILTNTVTLVSSSPADTNSSNNSASASVTPPQLVLIEEEPPAAGPGEDEAPPLPVTGGSAAIMAIPGLLSLAAGVYLRRRFL